MKSFYNNINIEKFVSHFLSRLNVFLLERKKDLSTFGGMFLRRNIFKSLQCDESIARV